MGNLNKKITMKSTFAAILAFCFSAANGAAVEHIQNSKELTIPRGTYSQFRIIGEGLNDANLAGDITSVSYSMKLTALKEHIAELRKDKTGAATPFDLYFLTEKDDYSANNWYESLYKFFIIGISSVSAMIFIMLICYCCATKKFNRVMNEQKEFKKQQLLKQGNGENP